MRTTPEAVKIQREVIVTGSIVSRNSPNLVAVFLLT
jgi:hypothetical protein